MNFKILNNARISIKLTIIYAFMFSVILILINALILFGIKHYLYSEADGDIEDTKNIILNIATVQKQQLDLSGQKFFSDISSADDIYIRIVKEDGELINSSEDFPSNINELDYDIKYLDDKKKHLEDKERHFAYKSVEYNSQEYGIIYFQIVKDMKSEYDFMKMVFVLMAVADSIGIIASILVGYIVSKKMLNPINYITKTADNISINNLKERIDITGPDDELKRLASTFNKMIDRLQDSFNRQTQFVSDASHELRTPIAVVQGHANLLDRWGKNDKEALEKSIYAIKLEASNMANLIEKLLFLAKGDSGMKVIEKKEIFLNKLIEEVIDESNVINEGSEAIPILTELQGEKFGEVWYETQYDSKDSTNKNTSCLNVYTDGNGAYIDADYNLGKIKVTTTESGASKTASVENTDDTYDAYTTKGDVSGSVDSTTAKVIGQDADYIYRIAKVTINTTNSIVQKINGIAVSGNSVFTQTTGAVSFNVIQKISKAQSSDSINGAKYAKTVTSYIISDDKGADKTSDLINDSNGYTDSGYTVVNGKLINYGITSDKQIATQTISLKSSNGYTYTDFADSDSGEDIESSSDSSNAYDGYALDIDADGNLWRLNGGYIYEWNNDKDWDKLYKVDGSFNEMSVYDKDNIVAWNESDAVYSIIGGTKAIDTPTDTTPATPTVIAGWVQAANGTWSYNKVDGTKATGWLQDGGTWYYLKADGTMATGWIQDGATWYYLQASGAMATGWLNDNGTWYYLNVSGAMLANTTVDSYVLGASGAWIR